MQCFKPTVSQIGETHPISTPSGTTLNNYKSPNALRSSGEATPCKDLFCALVGPLPAVYFIEIHVLPLRYDLTGRNICNSITVPY